MVLTLSACFAGVKKNGKVIGYKPGQVLTKKGFYKVGELPETWRPIKLDIAAVTLRNDALGSAISTDAYCDRAYDDSPLSALTRHLFAGLQEIKIRKEQSLRLDDREALRSSVSASLDGLPLRLETVVVKKDWCLFDFYLVSPPESFAQALPDFETFFRGFEYSGDL